jgi:hypothetical protein
MPWIKVAFFVAALLLLVAQPLIIGEHGTRERVSYSALLEHVRADRVAKVEIDEQELLATLKGADKLARVSAAKPAGAAPVHRYEASFRSGRERCAPDGPPADSPRGTAFAGFARRSAGGFRCPCTRS